MPTDRGQFGPRVRSQPGGAVDEGPGRRQVGARDAKVHVHRRPQCRPGEVGFAAIGLVTEDDLGDAREQNTL